MKLISVILAIGLIVFTIVQVKQLVLALKERKKEKSEKVDTNCIHGQSVEEEHKKDKI